MTRREMQAIRKSNEGVRTYEICCTSYETFLVDARDEDAALEAHANGHSEMIESEYESCFIREIGP